MMKQKILLLLILCVELFAVFQWTHCINFSEQFHYSAFDLELRLIENIHNDVGIPLWQVRMFHNKVVGSVFDIFGMYVQFWNVVFLASFISLMGVVGLGAGFSTFFSQKKKRLRYWHLLVALLSVPFLEIFFFTHFPFLVRLLIIALPFITWSMFGWWHLLQKRFKFFYLCLCFIFSLWYLLSLSSYCAEDQSRTDISCSSDMRHDHLGYLGIYYMANRRLIIKENLVFANI